MEVDGAWAAGAVPASRPESAAAGREVRMSRKPAASRANEAHTATLTLLGCSVLPTINVKSPRYPVGRLGRQKSPESGLSTTPAPPKASILKPALGA